MMSPLGSFLAAITPRAAGDSLSSCRRLTIYSGDVFFSVSESCWAILIRSSLLSLAVSIGAADGGANAGETLAIPARATCA